MRIINAEKIKNMKVCWNNCQSEEMKITQAGYNQAIKSVLKEAVEITEEDIRHIINSPMLDGGKLYRQETIKKWEEKLK